MLLALLSGCAAAERGTFSKREWAEMELRPGTSRRGLVERSGEVFVLEGDDELISGSGDALGIRFDEERNDLAAITARFAAEAIDAEATLVLFTTFDDRGAGGPAYFVPLYNAIEGTGMGPIDQRAEFGTGALIGIANLKRRAAHGARIVPDAAHELAHRHLAYLPPLTPASSTTAIDILGRQQAHWHALLHSDGSLMGGHELRERSAGRFVVVSRNLRFSALDLYGLGLLAPEEVGDFFFVAGGRTETGALIPEAAELEPGIEIFGERIALSIGDVVRAAGPRTAGDSELPLVFALLTRPGESATSTAVLAEAGAINALRTELETSWVELTRSRGTLCTRAGGCLVTETPDAGVMINESGGCGCAAGLRGEGAGHAATERFVSLAPALLLALVLRVRFRSRCRARERSCDRSSQRG